MKILSRKNILHLDPYGSNTIRSGLREIRYFIKDDLSSNETLRAGRSQFLCSSYRYARCLASASKKPTDKVKPAAENNQKQSSQGQDSERQKLESHYNIKIEKEDKAWSSSEIEDLRWSLARQSQGDAAALHGYHFLRWESPASRIKADPSYDPPDEIEDGYHEPWPDKHILKISIYDSAYAPEKGSVEATGEGKNTKPIDVPNARMTMLHEIGHAMATAAFVHACQQYEKRSDAYSALVDRYNKTDVKTQKVLTKEMDSAAKAVAVWDKRRGLLGRGSDGLYPAERAFANLTKSYEPITDNAKINAGESFAEAFAVFRLNPGFVEKTHREMVKWLASGVYLR
jgi:hypothetical protein